MNDERTMTVDEVIKLFGQTVFWNYLEDWPGDAQKESEYPLEVIDREITDEEFGERRLETTLRFVSGELSVRVATMYPVAIGEESDPENGGVTHCDVEFVQKLPLIIPALLSEIDRLRAQLKTAIEADHKSELFCKEMLLRCASGIHAEHALNKLRVDLVKLRDASDKNRMLNTSALDNKYYHGKANGFQQAIEVLDELLGREKNGDNT